MHIRRLTPADASAFQALRLCALLEAPFAFGSSYEEEKDFPVSTIEERLAVKADRGLFGAFENETLIGLMLNANGYTLRSIEQAHVLNWLIGRR